LNDSFSGITYIATCDLGGICRGRAVPTADGSRWTREGTGWVPASIAISPLGSMVEGNLFGALGDLRLVPDLTTRCEIPAVGSHPPFAVILGDLVNTDGTEWECSTRAFLRHAIAELKAETGLELHTAFEHEFTLLDQPHISAPLSLQALRRAEPFGSDLLQVLEHAGLHPETWHAEYGPNQWEITVAPADPATAADRAILVREIVHHIAEAHGQRITFNPVPAPGPVGNGVHVHLSLRAAHHAATMHDPHQPSRLSAVAESFAAGILRHSSALIAFTAPSPVSARRFGPGHWSVATAELGYGNREVLLRVCPTLQLEGCAPADHLNLEYRAADATANPWLVMAVLIKAGLEGIRSGLPLLGAATEGEPAVCTEGAAAVCGLDTPQPLPRSLVEALDELKADHTVMSWFAPNLISTYLTLKYDEIRQTAEQPVDALCARYSELY